MKKTASKKARALRNLLLLIPVFLAMSYFTLFPAPIPELEFRQVEKAHLVGPGTILGVEQIDYSWCDTMIVAETEEGVILWITGDRAGNSYFTYREKDGGNLLLAAPGSQGYISFAENIHLPLVLFDEQPKARRAEIQFTLRETINGEPFEKAYLLSAQRNATGYFCFNLDTGDREERYDGISGEHAVLDQFMSVSSNQNRQIGYHVPVEIRFYDFTGTLIAQNTISVSGEPG